MEETSLFIVLSVLALGSSYCYYRLQKMTPQGSRFRKLKKPVWWLAAFNILLLAISHVAGYPKALQILFYRIARKAPSFRAGMNSADGSAVL